MGSPDRLDDYVNPVDFEPVYGPRVAVVRRASQRVTVRLVKFLTAGTVLWGVLAGVAWLVSKSLFNGLLLAGFGWVSFVLFVCIGWGLHLAFTAYLHRKFVTRRFKEEP